MGDGSGSVKEVDHVETGGRSGCRGGRPAPRVAIGQIRWLATVPRVTHQAGPNNWAVRRLPILELPSSAAACACTGQPRTRDHLRGSLLTCDAPSQPPRCHRRLLLRQTSPPCPSFIPDRVPANSRTNSYHTTCAVTSPPFNNYHTLCVLIRYKCSHRPPPPVAITSLRPSPSLPAGPATSPHPTPRTPSPTPPSRSSASQTLRTTIPPGKSASPLLLPFSPRTTPTRIPVAATPLPPPPFASSPTPQHRLTVEPIPCITQPIPLPQAPRRLPLRPVHVRRADERAPPRDRIGPGEGEGEGGPGGSVADEAREVEAAGVGGVEGGGGGGGQVEAAGADDLKVGGGVGVSGGRGGWECKCGEKGRGGGSLRGRRL